MLIVVGVKNWQIFYDNYTSWNSFLFCGKIINENHQNYQKYLFSVRIISISHLTSLFLSSLLRSITLAEEDEG